MSRIPPLGTEQLDARFDGTPPRLRTRALWAWRASDGLLAPLNEAMSVAYRGRSSAATIHGSDGASGTLAAAAPAFTSIDWDLDGTREEDGLLMSPEEALRYYDATSNRLQLPLGAMTLRLEGIELGNAATDGEPYWSYTTDAATGAYLAVLGTGGAGGIAVHHYNGSATRVASLPLAAGDRFSARAMVHADGGVQLGLVRNGGSEALSAREAALAFAAAWGAGGATQIRWNEFGNSNRGTLIARYGALYAGVLPRRTLLEVL